MNRWLLDIIVCPCCKDRLSLDSNGENEQIESGVLACVACLKTWPIQDGIPRFILPEDDYCGNFGYQWKKFSRTQIDAFSGSTQSQTRFEDETGWDSQRLKDKLVLDAGCGAGRFADVALRFGAKVIAVDVSTAVDACNKNLQEIGHPTDRYALIQASIYELPFRTGTFEYVYSLGVIQHTPYRKESVLSLAKQIGQGELALWVYEKSWRSLVGYKYWFRIFTKGLSQKSNWRLSCMLVNLFFPLAWKLARVPKIGRYLVRLLPLAFRRPEGTKQQSKEWSLLDTFDNLSPRYDNPITETELREWLKSGDFIQIERRETPGLALVASK